MIPLPPAALKVVGSARQKHEYNAAREEWACEVYHGLDINRRPMQAVHVSAIFYTTNQRPEDGRFRPESATTLAPVMDAVYAAVIGAGFVDRTEQIVLVSHGYRRVDSIEEEHVEVRVTELGAPEEGQRA